MITMVKNNPVICSERTAANHPMLDLVTSYAKKHAAFAGTLLAMAGPKPLYRPLIPSEARIFLKASIDPENLGFL
jgi:hypothetical protein